MELTVNLNTLITVFGCITPMIVGGGWLLNQYGSLSKKIAMIEEHEAEFHEVENRFDKSAKRVQALECYLGVRPAWECPSSMVGAVMSIEPSAGSDESSDELFIGETSAESYEQMMYEEILEGIPEEDE